MPVAIDRSRDNLLTDFGRTTLEDRYMLPGESFQDMFARVAGAFADDDDHAQRLYDYMSKLWFMPSTPILSNGGAGRGLPISCFLNAVDDSIDDIKSVWMENVDLAKMGGGIGCVDADTEYLTPNGWKRIADFQPDDHVLVVNGDASSSWFEAPERYINAPATKMYSLIGKNGTMVVSDNHRNFVASDAKSGFSAKTTDYLLEGDRLTQARFKPSCGYSGGDGLPFTEIELRFLVALAADGTNVRGRAAVKFGLRRHRKIERLRWMLDQLGVDYVESQEKINTVFYIPDAGVEKRPLNFEVFGAASKDQIAIIFDEIGYWDGSFDMRSSNVRFSTMKKDEADFIQFVIMTQTGRRAGIGMKQRDGEWVARETSRDTLMVGEAVEFVPEDGRQYCFQTSTTFWLARRDGCIFVTGNTYWGNVRGIGEPVGKAGKTSGVVPFIKVMDSLTLAISQGSLRRGSAAVYIDIHHPEIEEFLELRKPSGDFNRRSLNLHHGVNITDEFMFAVRDGAEFALRSPKTGDTIKTLSARDLWQKVLDIRMQTGEPYLLFTDTANRAMPEHQKALGLKVQQSNLCSEILLHTGKDHLGKDRTAVCCLSSVNAEKFLEWKDEPLFIEDIMRFLDNVLETFIRDAPPSMANAVYAAVRERSVGLGLMGFHSFLQSQGIAFESVMAKSWNMRMFKHLRQGADEASRVIGAEKGPCRDWLDVTGGYVDHERFSHKLAIAPTASISIICGGVSAGIEPVPANLYTHKTLSGSFEVRNAHLERLLEERGMNTRAVWDSILLNDGSVQHLDCLIEDERATFKAAHEIDQRWVIELAADRTPFICQGQSVNLFIPGDVNKWDLHMLHWSAWEKGLKSLYYLRSKSVQRAAFAGSDATEANNTFDAPVTLDYDECLSCQ